MEGDKIQLVQRPRRNRVSAGMRNLIRETTLSPGHLVLPLFVCEGTDVKQPINAMPGCYRMSIDHVVRIAHGTLLSVGIKQSMNS